MKKFIYIILFLVFFATGCSDKKTTKAFTLSATSINIEINDLAHLPITLNDLDINDLTFDFTNDDIVYLESDVLIPLNIGRTTLTISYQNTKSTLEITITPELPKLRYSGDYLELGQKSRIDITNYSNSDFNWDIEDKSIIVLAVEDKLYSITALKIGSTKITVTKKDNAQITKTITIEVRENTPLLDAPLQLLHVGAKTQMQILNLNGKTLSDYEWAISDNTIINLDENFVVTALKEGKATITITSKTNNLVQNTFEITVGTPITETSNGEPAKGPLYLTPENLEATVQAGEVIEVKIVGGQNNYNYRWRTYDATILAATDQGKIIGIKEGRTTLVVQSKIDESIRGEIDITVVGTPNVDYADRIVKAGLSEEGYTAGPNKQNKFGDWFMYNNVDWCAIFVSWCANQAGVGIDVIPKFSLVADGVRKFQANNQYQARGEYQPKKGDIIFFQNDEGPSHVGIVTSSDDTYVYTIEGNTSNGVHQRKYLLTSTYILGYGLPAYPPYAK